MCLPDGETSPERSEAGEELTLDRRTAVLGAACLALSATIPGNAHAAGSVTASRPSPAAPLPRQSPIDLRMNAITFVKRLPRIRFRYPRSTGVTLVNTGSPGEHATVRADVPAGAAHVSLRGVRWDLAQFHWHTRSEHQIQGRDAPLEMHLVHTRPDGAFLVIAVFIERGPRNLAIAPLFRDLPDRPGDTRDVAGVNLRALLPDERQTLRYRGSLTTPPFTEPVRWVVFADPIHLSRGQIRAFRRLFAEGNSREVQRLNGRTVRSDAHRLRRRLSAP